MPNAYFLAPSLPPLALGEVPQISFADFLWRLSVNLSSKDLHEAEVLRRFIDLQNLRAFLLEQPLDPRGNLPEKEFEEALLQKEGLPEYVFDFIASHETTASKIRAFPQLLVSFFREEKKGVSGFLHHYLVFEREWRIVLTAIRSKQLGRDLSVELQFEDSADPIVAHVLAQKDAPEYEPPVEYADFKQGIIAAGRDPLKRNEFIAQYRYNKVKELVEEPLFSVDWILGYAVRLIIAEDWMELDASRGAEMLENMVRGKI